MKLYVGNLPFQASETDIANWFSEAGVAVDNVMLIRDRFSGEPRGFGFVEINDDEQGQLAIETCSGKELMGRALVVNEARPKAPMSGGDFGHEQRGGGPPKKKGSRRRSPRW